MNMGLIDHPLTPLIVRWFIAVDCRAAYNTAENRREEKVARNLLNAALSNERRQQAPDVKAFAMELRKWWSFDDGQMHTHSWHSREDFIERKLPGLLNAALEETK